VNGASPQIAASLVQRAGVVISARAADAGAEAIELTDDPFFVATAFQPQVGATKSDALHPLITAMIDAGLPALS
jgi:CTP synthase (UTP-ammonia lyase)